MSGKLTPVNPKDVAQRLAAGRAVLVDIREADEFAHRHIKGAISQPLSQLERAHLRIEPGKDVVFTCRSGMRTHANCERLAARIDGEAYMLAGGVDAWEAAGLSVVVDANAPLELIRQMQIAVGLLVLAGVILGVLVHQAFLLVSVLIGAGQIFSGVTGYCGMTRLLARAPWNRRLMA